MPRSVIGAACLAVVLAACGGGSPDGGRSPSTSTTTPSAPRTSTHTTRPGPSATAAGTIIELTVSGGEVTGADTQVSVPLGDAVTITVTADITDEAHVHGYDVHQDVMAGRAATISFVADIPGVFEVELEEVGLLLVKLEVR